MTHARNPRGTSRRSSGIDRIADGRPVLLWTTDGSLRLRSFADAAVDVVGRLPHGGGPRSDLVVALGLEGPNREALDAHAAALEGRTTSFVLAGDLVRVACRAEPTHDVLGRVDGTLCLALRTELIDLRDQPLRAAMTA